MFTTNIKERYPQSVNKTEKKIMPYKQVKYSSSIIIPLAHCEIQLSVQYLFPM